jgi:glyoxylase-like metal-dependent hydrolase (beta-lactamase superfamily II)
MSDLQLTQISDHVHWLAPDGKTDRPVLGAIIGSEGTLIVDAGASPAHANLLLDKLRNISGADPEYVVLTHWHWDHVFGSSVFDCPLISHSETQQLVEEMSTLDWSDTALDQRVENGTEIEFCRDMMKVEMPDRSSLILKVPDRVFETDLEIDLGNIKCQIVHVGGDHSSDSSIVYVQEEKILFLSDCMYVDLHHGTPSYTTRKLFPLIDKILSFDAEHYLFGHHEKPMDKKKMIEFTDSLRLTGKHIDAIGDNKEKILENLQEVLQRPPSSDEIEDLDAFLAGLRK